MSDQAQRFAGGANECPACHLPLDRLRGDLFGCRYCRQTVYYSDDGRERQKQRWDPNWRPWSPRRTDAGGG